MIRAFVSFIVGLFMGLVKLTIPVILNSLLVITMFSVIKYGDTTTVEATTGAEPRPMVWTLNQSASSPNPWYLSGLTYIDEGADTLTIQLPDSWVYQTRFITSTFRSNIVIYDASDTVITTIYLEDLADYVVMANNNDLDDYLTPYDFYEFDIKAMGLDDGGTTGDPYSLSMTVYLDDSVDSWTSTARDEFLSYVQDNYDYQIFTTQPSYRDFWFNIDDSENRYDSGLHEVYSVPDTAGAVNIQIENIATAYKSLSRDGTNYSYIQFYEGVTPSDSYILRDYFFVETVIENTFPVTKMGYFIPFDTDYELGTYTHYRLIFYSEDGYTYTGQQELSRNLEVYFSSYFTDVEFWVDDEIYTIETVRYDQLVPKPTNPTRAGYQFMGWYTPEVQFFHRGELFDFDAQLDATKFDTYGTFRLISRWAPLSITDDPATTEPTAVEGNILSVFTEFGFGGTAGRVIIFMVTLTTLVLFCMFKKVGGIATILVAFGVTLIFTILGFLPNLVIVLTYTVLLGAGITSFSMGGSTNE